MTHSEVCAEWLGALRYGELPDEVVARTKLRVLEVIGLMLAGGATPVGRAAREAALAMGTGAGARLIGHGDRTTPMCAALANGTMSQALEAHTEERATPDDGAATIVAMAFALGEAVGASGRELITVVAGALELTCRIGLAAPGRFRDSGFDAAALFSTFGAAYGASRMLDLDAHRMGNAVGIAGSHASGIRAWRDDHTQPRFLHAGWSAFSGIAAAFLAQSGFTGPAAVFESPLGFFASHTHDAGTPDFDALTVALGETWDSDSGAPHTPERSEAVRARFRENAAGMLPPAPIGAIIQRVSTLEQAQSLQSLLALCAAP
jgi:2-methylcitrate dehydratase PrpD